MNMETKKLHIVADDAIMLMDNLSTDLLIAYKSYRRLYEDEENEGHLRRACERYLDLLPKALEDLIEFEKIARLQLLGLNPPYEEK